MRNFVDNMTDRQSNSIDTDNVPTLYLLPVPLSDVAPEVVMPSVNIDIARQVKHFIVENIRSARRFLKRCDRSIDIDTLTFAELNEHTDPREVAAMLEPMKRGMDMAVISEAGCPAVADPGALAVAEAQRRGYRVRPLIGPSSILLSLMASGFNGQTWAFAGYLPHDTDSRGRALKEMQRRIERERQTQIFIETPYRNNKLIAELCQRLPGHMLLCVASDVTGPKESILTRPLSAWAKANYNYDKIPTIFLLYS
jgi:16S rRNA (cytidine1402-2'-O)-methyltransferase